MHKLIALALAVTAAVTFSNGTRAESEKVTPQWAIYGSIERADGHRTYHLWNPQDGEPVRWATLPECEAARGSTRHQASFAILKQFVAQRVDPNAQVTTSCELAGGDTTPAGRGA